MSAGASSNPDAVMQDVVEAIVQIGEVETPYRRAGRGRATLLLLDATQPDRDRVFRRLAAEGLVIEPLVLPDATDWPRWLRGVVDGLGLDRPDLAVSAGLEAGGRSFVETDPDRAGRLLVIDGVDP